MEPPAWAQRREEETHIQLWRVGNGWPARALFASYHRNVFHEQFVVASGIPTAGVWSYPKVASLRHPMQIALPTRPIWRGLLIDIAFYGVIAYLLLFVPRQVRRTLRRRRGLCVKCAYPVSEGTCPECGTATC